MDGVPAISSPEEGARSLESPKRRGKSVHGHFAGDTALCEHNTVTSEASRPRLRNVSRGDSLRSQCYEYAGLATAVPLCSECDRNMMQGGRASATVIISRSVVTIDHFQFHDLAHSTLRHPLATALPAASSY